METSGFAPCCGPVTNAILGGRNANGDWLSSSFGVADEHRVEIIRILDDSMDLAHRLPDEPP
jgi:hypothetical protein